MREEEEKEKALAVQEEQKALVQGFLEAKTQLEDLVRKQYLYRLQDMEIRALPPEMAQINDLRLFKITEMVYQKGEFSSHKFATVFAAVQSMEASVALVMKGERGRTEFYFGVRGHKSEYTVSSIEKTLRNALKGNFPGLRIDAPLTNPAAQDFFKALPQKNLAVVSCVADARDAMIKDDESFVQGLEKFARAMQGQDYAAVILAKSVALAQLEQDRLAYQNMYTSLSPMANRQLTEGDNTSVNISHAFTHGTSETTNYTVSKGFQKGWSYGTSMSESKADTLQVAAKMIGVAALGVAAAAAAPAAAAAGAAAAGGAGAAAGGAGLTSMGALMAGQFALGSFVPKTTTKGENHGVNIGMNENESHSLGQTVNEGVTYTQGASEGRSQTQQLTVQNKAIQDILERIDLQLKRLSECESLGMWECAAYFMAEQRETAEMAAGTYKALIRGEHSGVESSGVHVWGSEREQEKEKILEYVKKLLHPNFFYKAKGYGTAVVTPASLISSNELALHLGLPRKSLCGFPVTEHAEFAQEVVPQAEGDTLPFGKIYHMGEAAKEDVRLAEDSLTMHTFITGSTGAGKTNAVCRLLDQLLGAVPFLVIEPAKGEYKDAFGGRRDVKVYGTNPYKVPHLLQINPFCFPRDIHVMEHIDRLVEIFNACWPMYAAMPAILREALEESYRKAGWNLKTSEMKTEGTYPTFDTLLSVLPEVIASSEYSADTSSDYKGALLTRVRSLTNGIHGQIFRQDMDEKTFFGENAIIDLSRVGSSETKSLLMGLLILRLQEYRMSEAAAGGRLRHITVLEEAHHLLRRTSGEQSQESANLQGKAVEMISNAIAEMRAYGQGFVIADQSPGLMDMSVIRNTNTKIILRLPDEGDRLLVGKAAGLSESQIVELARLERGVAAISQSGWLEPVLCKIDKFKNEMPMESVSFGWKDEEGAAVRRFWEAALNGRKFELSEEEADAIRRWFVSKLLDPQERRSVEAVLQGKTLFVKQKVNLLGKAAFGKRSLTDAEKKERIANFLWTECGMEKENEAIRRYQELLDKVGLNSRGSDGAILRKHIE